MSEPTAFITPLLDAVAHQQAGRLEAAFAGFNHVLELEPQQPQALLFAGVLATRARRFDQAIDLLRRAAEVRPESVETRFAFGNALWAAGRKQEGRQAWQYVLTLQSRHLGALLNLARAQEEAGEIEPAVATCRSAVAAAPTNAVPRAALAAALRAAGELEASLAEADRAVLLDPTLAAAHYQRGTTLNALRRPHESVAALREAVRLAPGDADSLLNLANALFDLRDGIGAVELCRAAIAARPTMAEAHATLGFLLTDYGDLQEALESCSRAIELAPDLPAAHSNLGIALLSAGDLVGGFREYEWRRHNKASQPLFRMLPTEEWTGGPLAGRNLLVLAEQGLGDTIMFIRYAARLAEQGARVTWAMDRRLVRLLGTAAGVAEAVVNQVEVPPHDLWVDQMSLPHRFATDLATVPSPTAYLAADPSTAARWRTRLGPMANGKRSIGIAWAGNPLHSNDHNRSCPLDTFAAITRDDRVQAVSLQVGPRSSEASQLGLRDWSLFLTDFAETAALIDALDLVIAVDTSVAHLAAAMGKPTWILLPHCPEWRWLRGRSDTPWYQSVRLFHQPARDDWSGLSETVRAALNAVLAGSMASQLAVISEHR